MTLKSITLALFALFALAIVACGDDDGDGIELPPSGEYVFDVTGTMEVEFPAEGASSAAVRLHGAETGNVTGNLTSILEGNELTIPELALTVTFGSTTIELRAAGPESTGAVDAEGTTLALYAEVTTPDGEAGASDDPLQLETDDLFPGPPLAFVPSDRFEPLPILDPSGSQLLTINDFDWDLTVIERPPDDTSGEPIDDEPTDDEPIDGGPVDGGPVDGGPSGDTGDGEPSDGQPIGGEPIDRRPIARDRVDGESMSFTDDEGDTTDCGSGGSLVDPNGDILTVDLFPVPGGVDVAVGLAGPPTDSFRHPSFNVEVYLNRDGKEFAARGSIHLGEEELGYLDPNGLVIPETESNVRVDPDGVFFFFETVPLPGDTLEVLVFHLPVEGGPTTCDDFFLELP